MRTYAVIFTPEALVDIEQAMSYYEQQQIGLGDRFNTEVLSTLQSIRSNPFFAGVRYADIRCTAIKVFPFLVHYTIDTASNTVSILAVYSTYRKPLW